MLTVRCLTTAAGGVLVAHSVLETALPIANALDANEALRAAPRFAGTPSRVAVMSTVGVGAAMATAAKKRVMALMDFILLS
jgi:hypothetical protein